MNNVKKCCFMNNVKALFMNEQLKKRAKSLAWRTSMMILAGIIAFLLDNAVDLELPSYVVILLGLVGGEITKYLNK